MISMFSWNVNGIRAAMKKGLMEWIETQKPDILCLQETRALPSDLPPDVVDLDGYHCHWNPATRKGYSGVATLSRIAPVSVSQLGVEQYDDEGRVQTVEYDDFIIVNTYYPNSQAERKRIDYKIDFCSELVKHCNMLRATGKSVILCGDLNIAHKEIDLARPKGNEDSAGFRPEEREAFTELLAEGYVDTFRHFNQEPDNYTWWSYRGGARSRNVGWRLDYHVVDESSIDRVKAAQIHADVMGSDHCPVSVSFE